MLIGLHFIRRSPLGLLEKGLNPSVNHNKITDHIVSAGTSVSFDGLRHRVVVSKWLKQWGDHEAKTPCRV